MDEFNKTDKYIKWCIALASALFLFSILFGYWITIQNSEEAERALEQTLSQFEIIKNWNSFMIFMFIFLNNAIKAFFVIVLGCLFGIAPLMFVFLNGELIGFVLGVSQIKGLGIARVVVGITPHGILEIPAIMLSAGYGLWLGYRFYRYVIYRENFKIYFSFALRKYFLLILPLLFVAALIEAFITPFVISLFR